MKPLSVKRHWIKSIQFKQQTFATWITLRRTKVVCQICNSEDPRNGNGPGVSQGVLEEELFFFSIMTNESRNEKCSGVDLFHGNPPWKNASTGTHPFHIGLFSLHYFCLFQNPLVLKVRNSCDRNLQYFYAG